MESTERIYNVPLGDAYLTTRVKATRRAVDILRAFIKRHMKVSEENVKLSNKLNSFIWLRGRKKPPRHVKVKVIKENGIARVYLHDEKIEKPKTASKETKVEEKKVSATPETATAEKKQDEEKERATTKESKAKTPRKVAKKEEKSGE